MNSDPIMVKNLISDVSRGDMLGGGVKFRARIEEEIRRWFRKGPLGL
jgi:hypothetical protein